jgi:predicted transposase/invertase (TIGR01784 family)
VVSVHILFFSLLKDQRHSAYHHVFRVRADQDDAVLSPHLELHTIEMTKFPDLREGQPGEKWLYWLKHGHKMTKQEVQALGVPEIEEAERKLAMISQDRQMRVDYERRRMAQHDAASLREDSLLEGKRLGVDEGIRLGIDEGKRLGIDEGKRLGIDEGQRLGQHTTLINSIVTVLQARGFPLSAELRARLDAETDLARLQNWLARAVTAASAEATLTD